MAVFLAFFLMLANFLVLESASGERGILGGPLKEVSDKEILGEGLISVSLGRVPEANVDYDMLSEAVAAGEKNDSELPFPASLQDEGKPLGSPVGQVGIITYNVKKGDTLSRIATDFGISVQTITAANPSLRANALQIGKELNYSVLPTKEFLYRLRMRDKFIRDILDYPHEKILNKLDI